MSPKNEPIQVKNKPPEGKQRTEGKKTTTSDEGANWLKEAWRRASYTPFKESAIAAKASALGLRASVVMIEPRPAPKYGDLPPLSSQLSSSSYYRSTCHVPQRVLGKQRLCL